MSVDASAQTGTTAMAVDASASRLHSLPSLKEVLSQSVHSVYQRPFIKKKEKYWPLSFFFLSLGSIFKRCFSLYALYIQYSRNRTMCLDTLIVNQVDVQNNFCTANDQIAHGTWMNIFLYVV